MSLNDDDVEELLSQRPGRVEPLREELLHVVVVQAHTDSSALRPPATPSNARRNASRARAIL